MGKPEKKLKKLLLILGITGAVYGSFRFLLPPVVPFLIAWGLAGALRPSADWLSRHLCVRIGGRERRVPAGVAGMAELLLFAAALLLGIYLGGIRLLMETRLLFNRLPEWIDLLDRWLTGVCHDLEKVLCLKANVLVVLMREMLRGLFAAMQRAAMPFLMTNSVSVFKCGVECSVFFVLVFISVGLWLNEDGSWRERCRESTFSREFRLIGRRLRIVANAYLKTQGIIMLLTALICTLGFWLLKNPYSIMIGIGIGLLDALPVFGTGTVLIPWAALLVFRKKIGRAAAVFGIYLICYFLREFLEAKLMGDRVGLSALETLMAIYVGLKLFGIPGLFLGPIGLILIEDLVKMLYTEKDDEEGTAMTFTYPAVFTPRGDGKGYHVEFPDLECCVADGPDLEDAIEEAREAAYNWLCLELEEGGEFPAQTHAEDMELPEGSFIRQIMVRIKLLPDND